MSYCCAPLYKECPKYHGHKGNPGVTPGTCDAIGERAQVTLVWVEGLDIENASHPWRLEVIRIRPLAMCSLCHVDSRIWQFEWDNALDNNGLGVASRTS
jgi:hypothetical protein